MNQQELHHLLTQVRACKLCEQTLENGVRPVLQIGATAKILIAGQAPGSKVHATGIPFDDPSGDRLRDWMGINSDIFYDPEQIAILPMAFCYPGKGKSGDLPPPSICADTWRQQLLKTMPNVQLTLVIGQYAQAYHLEKQQKSLTETVKNWKTYGDEILPLPHPSPRNNIWLKKNPWFVDEVIPSLQARVKLALNH